MFGPTSKYVGIHNDPIDGVPITWRAHPDGYPTRAGDHPTVIEKTRSAQAQEIPYVRSQVFNIPDQLADYTKCLDWIVNTGAQLRFEERQVVGDGKWVAWLVWIDIRGYLPKDHQMR